MRTAAPAAVNPIRDPKEGGKQLAAPEDLRLYSAWLVYDMPTAESGRTADHRTRDWFGLREQLAAEH